MNKGELNIKDNFAIRFAKREDTKLIFNFIKELAEYEKLLNEVVADGKPSIYLEDLYVRSEYRGKGFGKKLLSYLANLCIERDCGRLE
ncbi:MAG TPA: GNAT family N-acetyltransferase [Tissierellales bacterium]|nr:GNAT family N-acetyltransferase [Tissierellales bacterium]